MRAILYGSRVGASALVRASVQGVPDAVCSGEVDPRPWQVATGARVGEVGTELRIGGVLVPAGDVASLSWEESLTEARAAWSVDLVLAEGVSAAGDPLLAWGPPEAEIEIDGVYRVDGRTYRFPLLRRGTAVDWEQAVSSDGRATARLSGIDASGRLDRSVTLDTIPAGHGLGRGTVAARILSAAGETRFALDAGRAGYREVQAVDARPLELAQDVLDVEARQVRYDRRGYVVAPIVDGTRREPVRGEIGPDRLAGASLRFRPPADPITALTLVGFRQVVEPLDDDCGMESSVLSRYSEAIYSPQVAGYVQGSGCALTATGLVPQPAELRKVQEVFQVRTIRCDAEIVSDVETWAYRWDEVPRYVTVAGSGLDCRGGVYLAEGATVSGAEPAHGRNTERWSRVSREVTRTYYDRLGFQGPSELGEPWGDHFVGAALSLSGGTGKALGGVTEVWGWRHRRQALKTRVPGQSFEETDYSLGRLVLGDGAGVATSSESFQALERQVRTIESDENGYLTAVTDYVYRWEIPPGREYWYSSGEVSDFELEQFVLSERVTELYVDDGEQRHLWSRLRIDGISGRIIESETEAREGGRPAVDRLHEDDPGPEVYSGGEDERQELAQRARPTQTQPIKREIVAAMTGQERRPNVEKRELTRAETVEDLDAVGVATVRLSWAGEVSATILPDWSMEVGQWFQLSRTGLLSFPVEAQLKTVKIAKQGDGPTSMTADFWVFPDGVLYGS